MTAFEQIAALVHERCGFAATPPLLNALRRVVTHRAVEMGGISLDDYLALLQVSPEEFAGLSRELIIPETFFFRYPESFTAFSTWIKTRERPLRVLSLACSTGEEAYTLAMCLLDAGLRPDEFVLEARDLNPGSIAAAQEGYYTSNSFRADSALWRDRFFTRKGVGWSIRSALRDVVRFRQFNLLNLSENNAWDVIFCRNVLIYFSPEQQRSVMEKMDRALAEGGIIFLGPAEPPFFLEYNWKSADFPMAFACVRRDPSAQHPPIKLGHPRKIVPAKTARLSRPPISLPRPSSAPRKEVTISPLERAKLCANEGRLDEAHQILAEILRRESENIDANLLMGIVEEARGRLNAAESSYRKVLFLMPSHLEALQHMKLLLRLQGREQAAARLGQRAARHDTSA